MKHKISPKNLAQALFDVAEKNNSLNQVKHSFAHLDELISDNSQFRAFIQSKKIKAINKADILGKILLEQSHPLVNEIFSYFKGSNAPNELHKTFILFDSLYKKRKNIVEVRGVVSSEMSDEEILSLKASLDDILGKITKLSIETDPSILGGIKLRIENTFLDASIQNQLQSLRTGLLQK
tara:strand:+ start:587 stop:1126 length:540 start_codon:yes stop_codon:yes gene_type:complete